MTDKQFCAMFHGFVLLTVATLWPSGMSVAQAGQEWIEVANHASPGFVETHADDPNFQAIWFIREFKPGHFAIYKSCGDFEHSASCDGYVQVGDPLPASVKALPTSIFVHSSGKIFFSEAAPECGNAVVWEYDPASNTYLPIRYLDPTAYIPPGDWTEDVDGNLWAGQYGQSYVDQLTQYAANLSTYEKNRACGPVRPMNVSYILKIAGPDGKPLAISASKNQ